MPKYLHGAENPPPTIPPLCPECGKLSRTGSTETLRDGALRVIQVLRRFYCKNPNCKVYKKFIDKELLEFKP